MSSTEQSGAPAEGSATPPAPSAEFPSFGTTRGSGLARGKRPSSAAASAASAAPTEYKPTAIEVINAPREYTNPFAPANPEPAAPAPAPAPAAVTPVTPVVEPAAPATALTPEPAVPTPEPVAPASAAEEAAQLNILPPAQQRTAPAQTWESTGFSPTRHESPAEEVDIDSIPPQFLYVRPGVKFVPTPKNWGGAPRERRPAADHAAKAPDAAAPAARVDSPAPAKSGGFLGWLKGLFGGSPAGETAAANSESGDERRDGGRRRHRGGRGRSSEGGGQRRHRGGRGRSRSRGESEGSRQGGSI